MRLRASHQRWGGVMLFIPFDVATWEDRSSP